MSEAELWGYSGIFNPDMLELARNATGLSQAKVASLLGVGQNTISRWESGARMPSVEEVQTIAEGFGRPVDFFYKPHSSGEIDGEVLFHRKRASTGKMVIRRLHSRIAVARVALKQLLSLIEKWEVRVPKIPIESIGNAASVAKRVRAAWKVEPGPIRDLFQLVESAGVVVFSFDFGCREIDAIGLWADDSPPMMFVNSASPADRIRFSVAHELGHLVMHSGHTDTMEPEADAFAGELLIPRASVKTELRNLTTPTIWRAKHRWRISGQAIIHAAYQAGMISETKRTSLMCYFSKKKWRRDEPYPIDPESPATIGKIMEAFQKQLGYTNHQIQCLTGLTSMEMEILLGITDPPPRVSIEL